MPKPRYLTLDQIQKAHPEISRSAIADAQHTCQPSGADAAGNVLFCEDMVLLAARAAAGHDPAGGSHSAGGARGVEYR